MNKNLRQISGVMVAGLILTASGCAVYPAHHHEGYGPPPHAPAHGYRAKYHSHDLVYDSHLGVYIVVGLPGFYFHNGYYYRHDHDGWYYSRKSDREWSRYDERKLPPGLAKKYKAKDKGKYRDNDKYRDRDRDRGRDDDRDRGRDRGRDRDQDRDRD